MDNTGKFTGLAEKYARYRPSYSEEFVNYLYTEAGFGADSIIADAGAGTGIFSRLLLEKGSKVYCVEPNSDMMKKAQDYLRGYPMCEFISSPAEKIDLPDNSVDFITSAQAFHWFDEEKFKKECKRLLKPGGKVVIVWNSKVSETEIIITLDEVNKKYCPNFQGHKHRGQRIDHPDFFKDRIMEHKSFRNDYVCDEENFIGAGLSRSYALKETDADYTAYISELKSVFSKYSINGLFTVPNVTECYIGQV